MKFICSVTVNKPKEKVVQLFSNPDNLPKFQDGFLRIKHISGEQGQPGAISKMYYKMGRGEMELTETIRENNLPDHFSAFYHHKHTDNTMKNSFTAVDANTTRYDAEIEYLEIRHFMPKIMSWIYPSFFKKQVQKWLNNFKAFAENQ